MAFMATDRKRKKNDKLKLAITVLKTLKDSHLVITAIASASHDAPIPQLSNLATNLKWILKFIGHSLAYKSSIVKSGDFLGPLLNLSERIVGPILFETLSPGLHFQTFRVLRKKLKKHLQSFTYFLSETFVTWNDLLLDFTASGCEPQALSR